MANWKLSGTDATATALVEMRTRLKAGPLPPTQFKRTLKALNLIGNPATAASVSSITRSGTTVTVTMAAAHAYVVGDTVAIAGASQTDYNNGWRIATVPTSTTFTFEMPSDLTPVSPATGTITCTQTAQFNLGALGDSVANLTLAKLLDPWVASMPSLFGGLTNALAGDAWTADGTSGKEYDTEIAYAGQYISLGSGGSVVYGDGGANPTCDYIAIYYVKESGAGTFKVQVSTDVGSPSTWTDVTGYTAVSASNATKTWGRILIRRPRGRAGIKISHVSGGRVRITNCIFRSLSASGYQHTPMNVGGSSFVDTSTWITAMRDALLADMSPTLWFVENKESQANYQTGEFAAFLDASIAASNCEFVIILTTPNSSDTGSPESTGTYLENLEVRSAAAERGLYYYDAWAHFRDAAGMNAVGWIGDGTHPSGRLNEYIATLIAAELAFLWIGPYLKFPWPVKNASVSTGALTIHYGSPPEPWLTITPQSASVELKAATAGVNSVKLLDVAGTERWRFSTHASESGNYSLLPEIFGWAGGLGFIVRALTNKLSLRASYGGAVNSVIEAINTPVATEKGFDSTITIGESYIATSGSLITFTLPASATVGQVTRVTGLNVASFKIAQPAGVQIRAGANATTSGTAGSITLGTYDSITLEAVTATQWRVIAVSPGATLTWA